MPEFRTENTIGKIRDEKAKCRTDYREFIDPENPFDIFSIDFLIKIC